MVKKIFSNKFDPQIIGTDTISVKNDVVVREALSSPPVKYLTVQITDEENRLFLDCFKNSTYKTKQEFTKSLIINGLKGVK